MSKKHWTEHDNPDRVAWSAGLRLVLLIVGAVVLVGGIGAGIWAFNVSTSEIKGAGDQTRIVNDAKNRIAAQETFEALYQQIQTYDRQLDQAAKDKAENPGSEFFATNYSGLVKSCQDAIGQYNADARKVTRAKWQSRDLPYEIDITNPLFDCKETQK